MDASSRVRVYGPRQAPPVGAVRANVTSKAVSSEPKEEEPKLDPAEVIPFSGLSPFNIGPVTVYPGQTPLEAKIFENAWQHMKLYAVHASPDGLPTREHARWMLDGIHAGDPRRFPMGRGAKPLCSIWRNRRLGYVEARLLVYIPGYVEGLLRDPEARKAFQALSRLYQTCRAQKKALALFDFDGYDHVRAGKGLAEVMANPDRKMGHAFVLAGLLEGSLAADVRRAAALTGLPAPEPRDLPPDLSPFRSDEEIPGLIGGAVVHYRPDFLGRMADRYFGLFRPGGLAQIPWERRTIVLFGRECHEKHDTAFFGDPGTSYRYSGKDHTPLPWDADPSGALGELLAVVRIVTKKPFNFLLMNLYAPADSIGAHSDDERDLVEGVGIFSISLGRPRLFCMEHKGGAGARGLPVSQRLAHGSALWMTGQTQLAYKHYVGPEAMRSAPGETGPSLRVNLTFRCVRVSGTKA